MRRVFLISFIIIILIAAMSFTRIQSALSVEKISDYPDYNLYSIDILYDYNLDRMIENGIGDDQSYVREVISEVLPFIPIKLNAPKFGCGSFNLETSKDGHFLMGRNYDFKRNTSAMLVRCNPDNGYSSIAFAALENLQANKPDSCLKMRIASLVSPFACLDGINEKGVSISVLMLDSKPTRQNTGKPVITTGMAIRLVLDRAASTEEAVEILSNYDMFSSANGDYHFYITDASGDGRVVEYDPYTENRNITAVKTGVVTNFYIMYADSISVHPDNGLYSHGRDRYEKIDSVLSSQRDNLSSLSAWEALKVASKPFDKDKLTSNTQWSSLYDNTNSSASIVIRRDWSNVFNFKINK